MILHSIFFFFLKRNSWTKYLQISYIKILENCATIMASVKVFILTLFHLGLQNKHQNTNILTKFKMK